jgi:CBS domain-containing protein
MSSPVASIEHDASLQRTAEALAADEVGALVVLRKGVLVGIVSERDVVAHVAASADLEHLAVGEVMTVDPVTVEPDATLPVLIHTFAEAGVRHLPVVRDRAVVGMVSVRDVLPVETVLAGVLR